MALVFLQGTFGWREERRTIGPAELRCGGRPSPHSGAGGEQTIWGVMLRQQAEMGQVPGPEAQ